jgi:hypothetical protein
MGWVPIWVKKCILWEEGDDADNFSSHDEESAGLICAMWPYIVAFLN